MFTRNCFIILVLERKTGNRHFQINSISQIKLDILGKTLVARELPTQIQGIIAVSKSTGRSKEI